MSYRYLINGAEVENIVRPSWSDDLQNFSIPFLFSTYATHEVGSLFQILTQTGETVLKGVITDFEQTDENVFQYSGFDFGFYINQNEIIEQLKQIKISDAIKKICENYSVPVGNIPEMSATVSQIFKDKKLSDVIKELMSLAIKKGCIKDVYTTCAKGVFEILPYETITDLSGEMGTAFSIISTKTLHSPSIKVSMQDMRNRILIADNSAENLKYIKAEDAESISQYGLLQEVETVDTQKTNNLPQLAQSKLKELNKLSKTYDGSMIGDYRMHKGVIIPIDDEKYGIKGNFLIKSSSHQIDGTVEKVAVSLEMRDE